MKSVGAFWFESTDSEVKKKLAEYALWCIQSHVNFSKKIPMSISLFFNIFQQSLKKTTLMDMEFFSEMFLGVTWDYDKNIYQKKITSKNVEWNVQKLVS